jgi:GDP-mannose 6-dehydrogenase
MDISVFGLGYVGCVSLGCLARSGHRVTGVDTNKLKVDLINQGKATILENGIEEIITEQIKERRICATSDSRQAVLDSEVSIIAVGTPSSDNGSLNLDSIFEVSGKIGEALTEKESFHVVAIRSTATPGTVQKVTDIISGKSGKEPGKEFAVVSNPEFLREGTAVHDFFHPPYTLIGSEEERAVEIMKRVYGGIESEIVVCNVRTAELIKFVNNSFHALKVAFANEVGNVCKSLGIDSHELMDIFAMDKTLNISSYYLRPGFAFGGSCLPKDLKGLLAIAHDKYLALPVLQSIGVSNQRQIERLVEMIIKEGKKKVGFLGLAFKEGTDDLRNSPSVQVIETLLGKGYGVMIFDSNVSMSHLLGKNKEFITGHIPHMANLLVDSINKVIDFADIIVVGVKERAYRPHLKDLNGKLLIDLVRFDEQMLGKENYIGINW